MINEGGIYYNRLTKYENFKAIINYIESDDLETAYQISNQSGNQMTCALTMYLLKEHGIVFRYEPLYNLEYVPENYLYEANDETLNIFVDLKEIKQNAFRYCRINKLTISQNVEIIGDSALCLNKGKIEYMGNKQEFIDKFLGKSKCFMGTQEQVIICSDGKINIHP